jgi:DNA-binding FadR family transcriptional regulator
MTLEPQTPTALPQQLADRIRDDIDSGLYPPGAELPSERLLARAEGVGIDAIRDALTILRDEGLISTRRGFAARVRDTPQHEPVMLPPGSHASARMPTPGERTRLGIEVGVPVIEVHTGTTSRLYAADRYALTAGWSRRSAAAKPDPNG